MSDSDDWITPKPNAISLKQEGAGVKYTGFYSGATEITNSNGKQTIWNFKDDAGKQFGIYGFENLNASMIKIPLNAYVRIEYLGMKNVDTKYGKDQPVHQVTVEYKKPKDAD